MGDGRHRAYRALVRSGNGSGLCGQAQFLFEPQRRCQSEEESCALLRNLKPVALPHNVSVIFLHPYQCLVAPSPSLPIARRYVPPPSGGALACSASCLVPCGPRAHLAAPCSVVRPTPWRALAAQVGLPATPLVQTTCLAAGHVA